MKNFYLTDLTKKKYTDVTITINDNNNNTITKQFHRLILASRIPFFDKLFTFADQLSKTEFTILVADANVALDVMLSIYGPSRVVTDSHRNPTRGPSRVVTGSHQNPTLGPSRVVTDSHQNPTMGPS